MNDGKTFCDNWKLGADNQWGYYKDGQLVKNAYIIDHDNEYYVDANGKMITGLIYMVLRNIVRNGFKGPHELFCMEWTPRRGFYFVTFDGDVKRDTKEILATEIENEVQT